MNPKEKAYIQEWNQTLTDDVALDLIVTDDERSQAFRSFADRLGRLAPRLKIGETRADAIEMPAFLVQKNIRYCALPEQRELAPFLRLLSPFEENTADMLEPTSLDVAKIKIPASLALYIAVACPFCPVAVEQLASLAFRSARIHLSIIDASLFPESAKENNIQSVPTALLDGRYRWTGTMPINDIILMIVKRDPKQLSASSMESMIKEGDSATVAQMMLDSGHLFPAFLGLLVHEKWPVRLGAMVAMETIVEKESDLAARAIDPLWERFSGVDDTVKGDILYLLGEIGNHDTISRLETIVATNANPELQEAAIEAVDRIKERQ